jgi:hypothetical protein
MTGVEMSQSLTEYSTMMGLGSCFLFSVRGAFLLVMVSSRLLLFVI